MHGQSRRSEGPARYSNCERTDNGDCDRERISLDRHFASKSYCGENNNADAWLLKWVASLVARAVTTLSGKNRNGCDLSTGAFARRGHVISNAARTPHVAAGRSATRPCCYRHFSSHSLS